MLLLLELYSIILDEYIRKAKEKSIFTSIISIEPNSYKRNVYRCSGKQNVHNHFLLVLIITIFFFLTVTTKDVCNYRIQSGDYALVKHTKNRFLAYVTKSEKTVGKSHTFTFLTFLSKVLY